MERHCNEAIDRSCNGGLVNLVHLVCLVRLVERN